MRRSGRLRRPGRVHFLRGSPPAAVTVHTRPYISQGSIRVPSGQLMRSSAGYTILGTAVEATRAANYANNRALGLNTLRIGVKTASVGRTPQQQFGYIDTAVALAEEHNQYIMLLEADATPGDWATGRPASKATSLAFWEAMAPRYADNHRVIFEQVNEPSGNGNLAELMNNDFTPTALQEDLHDVFLAMRALAPNTVIILASHANFRYSGGAAGYINFKGTLDGMGGINWTKTAFGFHWYNQTEVLGLSAMNATDHGVAGITAIREVMPLAMTETNWFVEVPEREPLVNSADYCEDMGIAWVILRRPGQTSPANSSILAPAYLDNKIADLLGKNYVIPVE